MKKSLLSLLAGSMCVSASALTVDDLANMRAAVVLQGNDFQLSLPTAASGAWFTKLGGKQMLLNNMYDGMGRYVTLESNGNLTIDLYNGVSGPFNWGNGFPDVYSVLSICREIQAGATIDGESAIVMCWQYGMLDESATSNAYVPQDADGNVAWAFNYRGNGDEGAAFLLEWVTKDAEPKDIQCFNGITIYAYPTESTATEYQGMMTSDMYPVSVKINDDGSFYIKNFLNQGMSYRITKWGNPPSYGVDWVRGTIDKATGEVLIPIQDVAGTADFGYIGDLSPADSFLGNGLLFENGPQGYWFTYVGTGFLPWKIIDASTFDGESAAPISGTYSTGNAMHNGSSRWVTNDGNCTTSVSAIIELESVGLYAEEIEDIINTADRIVIETPAEQTVDVSLQIAKAQYANGRAVVMGQITSKANSDLVDHYDVYAAPGRYESIYDGGFFEDKNIGHTNAVLVYDGTKQPTKDYLFLDGGFSLDGANTGARDYTYFIKTYYKPESGLEPTFHAMTPYSTQNSADEIELAEGASITAANGVITILGSDEEATVYNAAGTIVYQGFDREIPATTGVYMVRLGSVVKKVVL